VVDVMRPFRVAVLGAGFMGQAHLAALRQIPGVDVAVLVDHTLEAARAKAQYWGVPRWGTDWREVVGEPDIDVIHNCLPNDQHVSVLRAAVEANQAVFCEKPLARSLAEADTLVRWLDTRPALPPIGINYNYRYYPQLQALARSITQGRLGELRFISGHYLQDWLTPADVSNWRLDPARGGEVKTWLDIGTHWMDLVQWLTGIEVVRLAATAHEGGRASSDTLAVLFEARSGVMGSVLVSQAAPGHANDLQVELVGTTGSVVWRQEDPEHLWWGRYPERMEREARSGSVVSGAPTTMPYPAGHPVGWPTALRLGIEAFVAAVASHTPPKLVAGWQDAYRMMVLADMVQQSVETGQWVAADAR